MIKTFIFVVVFIKARYLCKKFCEKPDLSRKKICSRLCLIILENCPKKFLGLICLGTYMHVGVCVEKN